MARRPAGTLDVIAHSASGRWPTPRDREAEREHRNGYPSRQGSSSSMRSNEGQPFRTVVRELQLTPNQVWGLTKTVQEWSEELEAALTATR
jgi:hypothetical protein